MTLDIRIAAAGEQDLEQVLAVERAAFATNAEARLTAALLKDPSASPRLSLLAFFREQAVGHILFTHARLERYAHYRVAILAPLAVIPDFQRQGIGASLIQAGMNQLEVDLVFVLGHMEYYPRFGFVPAHQFAIEAPHPRPEKYRDAWMVYPLRQGLMGQLNTKVRCCQAFDQPEHWC